MEDEHELKGLKLALFGRKKIFISGPEQRWLDNDSRITLTVKQRTSGNVEFYVNGVTSHTIWYSQLAEVFIRIDNQTLCSGEIIKKNGDRIFTRNLSIQNFIDFVRNKTFKVVVNPDGEVAKFDGKAFSQDTPYDEAAKMIKDFVIQGEYSKAASYLLPSREYNLVEI